MSTVELCVVAGSTLRNPDSAYCLSNPGPSISALAVETCDLIVSFLPPTTASYKNASLINSMFFMATRRFLFSRVICASSGPHRTVSYWRSIVERNSLIRHSVRLVHLCGLHDIDVWEPFVKRCDTGASLHQITFEGGALPFPWNPWLMITSRKTLTFTRCAVYSSALNEVITRNDRLKSLSFSEQSVIIGESSDESSSSLPVSSRLEVLCAMAYGKRRTILSFRPLRQILLVACQTLTVLHLKVAPDQSDFVYALLDITSVLQELLVSYGQRPFEKTEDIEGVGADDATDRVFETDSVTVSIPPLRALKTIELEGAPLQAKSIASTIKNWRSQLSSRLISLDIHLYDGPDDHDTWVQLCDALYRFRFFRRHTMYLLIDGKPRWVGQEANWLDWISRRQMTFDPVDTDIVLHIDLI